MKRKQMSLRLSNHAIGELYGDHCFDMLLRSTACANQGFLIFTLLNASKGCY